MGTVTLRLWSSLLVSALLHAGVVVPLLARWLGQPDVEAPRFTVARVQLREAAPAVGPVKRVQGEPWWMRPGGVPQRRRVRAVGGGSSAVRTVAEKRVSATPQARVPPRAGGSRGTSAPPVAVPHEAAYPTAQKHGGTAPGQASAPSAAGEPAAASDAGDSGSRAGSAPVGTTGGPAGNFTSPVMLQAPKTIPLPESLKHRGGTCSIQLRCIVEADGSSEVSLLDSTGSADLDAVMLEAFSKCKWYPGEQDDVPVRVPLRLIIDASWKFGDDSIAWRGRTPR